MPDSKLQTKPQGPDLAVGVELASLADSKPLLGHARGEAVLLVREGDHVFAVGAHCTHVGAPLANGLVANGTIRCPWHHACFNLHNGDAECAPAFDALKSYEVSQVAGLVKVLSSRPPAAPPGAKGSPASVTIVGAGAAGHAAAEMLRKRGYTGPIYMLSADTSLPYDRTGLSKFFLGGAVTEEKLLMRSAKYYDDHQINIRLGARASLLNPRQRQLTLASGQNMHFDQLLLATGAEPQRPRVPGAGLPHVFVLRSLEQGRMLLEQLSRCKRAVVVGTGFIGLEVASSLRARNIAVEVIGRDPQPLAKVLGAKLSDFLVKLHEKNGVVFHLGEDLARIEADKVVLQSGKEILADTVIVGVGVKPHLDVAKSAGLKTTTGVVVDRYLQSNVSGIFAAGDIAEWPYGPAGESVRIEHWAVAQRQGQIAARNMLDENVPFDDVPFFWTMQHKTSVRYVGHAAQHDRVDVHGSMEAGKIAAAFWHNDNVLAVATVGCDEVSLQCEAAMQRNDPKALAAALRNAGALQASTA